MTNRELMLNAIDIMENHLEETLSIADVAAQIGFSNYYFTRLFKVVTDFTPKQYYISRKLTASVKTLLETDHKILDIAYDYGFGSHEVYSRAFFKQFQKNPSDVRKEGSIDQTKLVYRIKEQYLNKYDHAIDKEPEIVELGEIRLIGIQFYHDLTHKNDLSEPWKLLTRHLALIEKKIDPNRFYQLQYWLENQDMSGMFFYVAVEVEAIENYPEAMTMKVIPPQKYLKFRHKGRANEVNNTFDYIYEVWLPQTSYKLPGSFNFEYYGEDYLGPYNDESISEIYIPLEMRK